MSMFHRIRFSTFLVAAIGVFCGSASAFTEFTMPTVDYINRTNVIPITGADSVPYNSVSDGTQTLSFSNTLLSNSVPNTWRTWAAPPETESATPRVLYNAQPTLTITLDRPRSIFGFEIETFYFGVWPISVTYYSGATPLGVINRNVEGDSGARLLAASSQPITHAVISTPADALGFAVAQLRYAKEIMASFDLKPDTLNVNSNGKVVTGYIELPAGFDVASIDLSSVALKIDGVSIPALAAPSAVGDYDGDGVLDLMVKFDAALVKAQADEGIEAMTVSGMVSGIPFAGTDNVRVVAKGGSNTP